MRHPHAKEGAEWVWVAQQKAWQLGINPGGEIGVTELPRTDPRVAAIPRSADAEAGARGARRRGARPLTEGIDDGQ
jgi:hypothetical protein